MKITHSEGGCGGDVVPDIVDKGAHAVVLGWKCAKCGSALHETVTDLFAHGRIAFVAEGRFDEPIRPKRTRYPKKTKKYRKSRSPAV